MNWEVDILDTSQLEFKGDFDAQVQEIFSFVRLTAEKVNNLKYLFDDLEHAMQHLAPGCNIHPFGSVVTGLGIRTSDVDCYVALPRGDQPSVDHVIQARNILRLYHRKFTQIFAITKAKVPIVKFVHIPTQRHCDINFKSPAGVQNSRLLAFLLHWDRRALPLAILIKYWSKIHKFTGTNLLGNYALITMVIFYLQLINILPPVYVIQRNVPHNIVQDWNTAFDDNMFSSGTSNADTLYDLMGGFFKCYSTFDFKENIISPFIGRLINKKCFEQLDSIPEQFYLYKENITKGVCKKLNTASKICIQDAFEHNRNCSAMVFDKLANRIVSHFQFASKKFEEEQGNNFLRAILTLNSNSAPTPKQMKKQTVQNKIKKRNNKKSNSNGFVKWFAQMNSLSKGKA